MKRFGTLLLFVSVGLLLAVAITRLIHLPLEVSLLISGVCVILVYLVADHKPEANPKDETIFRLTKGSWHRKKP